MYFQANEEGPAEWKASHPVPIRASEEYQQYLRRQIGQLELTQKRQEEGRRRLAEAEILERKQNFLGRSVYRDFGGAPYLIRLRRIPDS